MNGIAVTSFAQQPDRSAILTFASEAAPGVSFASFRSALDEARAATTNTPSDLRQAAEHMVSSAFITPMLGAMRESSRAAGPFAPGTVERRFGPLFDREIADRVTQASGFRIVDAIIERYGIHGMERSA